MPDHRFDGHQVLRVSEGGDDKPFEDPHEERQAWVATIRALQGRLLREVARTRLPTEELLAVDHNPPAFRDEIMRYLEGAQGAFNYDALVATHLAIEGYLGWCAIIDAYHSLQGARVLVSGCGTGGSLIAHHAFGAAEVTGYEVDPALVALSAVRTQGLPGVEVVQVDPREPLPFPDRHFDLIESLDVIEHVDDLEGYGAQLGRVLRPGGTLLVAAPNRMHPVEQHTGVRWVTLLPLRVADALCSTLAKMPWWNQEFRQRMTNVAGVRSQNVNWRTVERFAAAVGATSQRVHRHQHAAWPMTEDPRWAQWLARQPRGAGLAPTQQVIGVLTKL